MKKFTVAGEIIGLNLLGYSLKDLTQAVGIPAGIFILYGASPLESAYALPVSIIGFTLGILILYIKPDSLTPLQYIVSGVKYIFTPNTYYKDYGRDENDLEYQDTVVTAFNSEEDEPEKYRK